MFKSFKLIWSKIPKKWISTFIILVLGVILKHLFDVYFNDAKLLSWPKVVPILIISLIFLLIYFGISFLFVALKIISKSDSKKVLPYKYVCIGIYETADNLLAVNIQAKIVLSDIVQPDIQNFLNRIGLGDPYCAMCNRPLELLRASWMADGVQIGYKCPVCNIERNGAWVDLRNEVYAGIRSDYNNYWKVYKAKIKEITGGKPEDYTLPS